MNTTYTKRKRSIKSDFFAVAATVVVVVVGGIVVGMLDFHTV